MMELAISLSVSAVMILAVVTCYSYLTRGFLRAGYAGQMESASRVTLNTFGSDVASSTGVTTATTSSVAMSEPSGSTVTYSYSATAGTLTRAVGSNPALTILRGVKSLAFSYYNSPTSTTTAANAVKLVAINFTTFAGSQTSGNKAELPVQSAMVLLRNKSYLQ